MEDKDRLIRAYNALVYAYTMLVLLCGGENDTLSLREAINGIRTGQKAIQTLMKNKGEGNGE